MRRREWFFALIHALVVVLTLVLVPGASAKPKFKVLASVPGGLWTGLTLDARGNLYGVTSGGGDYGEGSVFQLTPDAKGKWTVTTLHSFDGKDGSSPNGNLIFDAAGHLYGTTLEGGVYVRGTVFELSPGSSGWTFSVLYDFCPQYNCPYGEDPGDGLVLDKVGNLYGTAGGGGSNDYGVAYELTPASGGWNEGVLYNFGSKPYDSTASTAPLILTKDGDLYGAGQRGGRYGGGTLFKLTHLPGGWQEQVLYGFGNDGGKRGWYVDGIIPGALGGFYGTALQGGSNKCDGYHCGVLFQLTLTGQGRWKETIPYDFAKPQSGFEPVSPLATDDAGHLYGTGALGGDDHCTGGCGVVFELSPHRNQKWTYTVLHRFNGSDGGLPDGGVIRDQRGNLYGVAYSTVFEVTP